MGRGKFTKEQMKIYTEYEESPCIFICTLVDNGQEDMCIGCGRTDKEIENFFVASFTSISFF